MLGFHALGQQALGATATDDLVVIADAGAFTLTGQAAGLLFHRRLSAGAGSFAVSGVIADSLIAAKRLQVLTGGGVRGLNASAGGGGSGLRIRA